MLVGCREHARAFCRISIAELRRTAPPTFTFFMVVSILLADGLFPVFASKYRSQASLYVNSHVARGTNSGGAGDGGVLSSVRTSGSSIRYRTKARVKPPVAKRQDSGMNVEVDSGNSRLTRPHLLLTGREVDVRGGEGDKRNERGIKDETRRGQQDRHAYVEFSPSGDKISATSGLFSAPSASAASKSSLKSVSQLSSSPSLPSPLYLTSNSSNRDQSSVPPPFSSTGNHQNDNVSISCQDEQQISSTKRCELPKSSRQCLILTSSTSEIICNCQKWDRITLIRRSEVTLRFCSSYSVASASCASSYPPDEGCPIPNKPDLCKNYLKEIIKRDDEAERMYAGFLELYNRYDCKSNYSVKWHCRHCQQAYKDWLCSQTVKFFRNGKVVPPCMEFCSHVEEMCPFFRPKLESYAGDHSFICKDPHMSFPSSIPEDNCYGLCDLWRQEDISKFYCSHGNLRGAICPLTQNCHKRLDQHDTVALSNNSIIINNATSVSNAMYTVSRTPAFSLLILQILVMALASFCRLPLTFTELQYIPKGLT